MGATMGPAVSSMGATLGSWLSRGEIDRLNNQLNWVNSELQQRDHYLNGLNSRLQQKDDDLKGLRSELQQKDDDLKAMQNLTSEMRAELDGVDHCCVWSNASIWQHFDTNLHPCSEVRKWLSARPMQPQPGIVGHHNSSGELASVQAAIKTVQAQKGLPSAQMMRMFDDQIMTASQKFKFMDMHCPGQSARGHDVQVSCDGAFACHCAWEIDINGMHAMVSWANISGWTGLSTQPAPLALQELVQDLHRRNIIDQSGKLTWSATKTAD